MSKSGGVGHGSRDNIRPIKCRFTLNRRNGGHIFRLGDYGSKWSIELRIALEERTTFDVSDLILSLLDTAWTEL